MAGRGALDASTVFGGKGRVARQKGLWQHRAGYLPAGVAWPPRCRERADVCLAFLEIVGGQAHCVCDLRKAQNTSIGRTRKGVERCCLHFDSENTLAPR